MAPQKLGLPRRYLEAVIKEWNRYAGAFSRKPVIQALHLVGGTPTFFRPEELEHLVSHILSSARLADHPHLSFEAHPVSATSGHLQVLYDLGFRHINFGVQDFSADILKAINRYQSEKEIEFLTLEARKIGYHSVNYELVYGLPLQKGSDIRYNLLRVADLRPDRVSLLGFPSETTRKGYLPGSWGLNGRKESEKQRLFRLGKSLLELQGYVEIGSGHFVLPLHELHLAFTRRSMGRSVLGFMPYESNLLLGLGASAISDAWTSLVQNEPGVKNYVNRIEKNDLALIHGHELSDEDLIVRQHIQNLTCKYETSWRDPKLQHLALDEGIMRMREPLIDGLVELSPFQLKVTELGKPFVNQISQALDARYWRRQAERAS